MDHRERLAACRTISQRLVEKYPRDVIATGVTGSVARGEDLEYSDVDFQVIAKQYGNLTSHRFILKNCLFSVEVKTEGDRLKELKEPDQMLPVVIGSLRSALVFYDQDQVFQRLRTEADNLTDNYWKIAIRVGMEEIIEDLGRVRNGYLHKDLQTLYVHAPHVAEDAVLVKACLERAVITNEKDPLGSLGGSDDQDFREAFTKIVGTTRHSPLEIVDCLEFLYTVLYRRAGEQKALPKSYESAMDYEVP